MRAKKLFSNRLTRSIKPPIIISRKFYNAYIILITNEPSNARQIILQRLCIYWNRSILR